MKILGICCSPRAGQSTFKAMEVCLQTAASIDSRVETQLIELAGKKIGPCTACNICKQGLICGWDGKDSAHFGAALFSGAPGSIEADKDGLNTACNLGRRIAELSLRLA